LFPEGPMSPEAAIGRFLASLKTPARILVAISGGSDSTGLLLLLLEALKAAPDLSISLCAATVDHALRDGSADEAHQVAALCTSKDISHRTMVWQDEKPKTGIMAAAREARYRLLAEAAEAFDANLIVTGHTLDDQGETLQMRGMRSEQISTGIADAMLFDRRFWVLRPLLFSARADIRGFLSARGMSWIDDPSNEDVKYERVRTRRQLSADAKAETNITGIWDERLALSSDGAEWLDRYFRLHGGLLGQVIPDGLRQDRTVVDYALGRLTAVFGGQPFGPGRAQMEQLLAFSAGGKPGRMSVGRVVFDLRRDGLYLARETRGILPLVLPPGSTRIWDGRFEVRNRSEANIGVEAAAAGEPSFLYSPEKTVIFESAEGGSYSVQSIMPSTRCGRPPLPSTEHFAHLPKAAWKRAVASAPALYAEKGTLSPKSARSVDLAAYFAPFDRFLTRFDFTFANRLSAVFSKAPYAEPPFKKY
jgi:tRNA(Ile)-lysidine synthase